MPALAPRYWLIGASTGIGEALAVALAKRGIRLALSARNAQALTALVDRLEGAGHMALPLDVRQTESITRAHAALLEAWGGCEGLIYNAGDYDPMGAAAMKLEPVERMIDVNLTGAFRALHVALPSLLAAPQAHVVLVASAAAYRGLPNAMGYGASKAGVLHLAEQLATEFAPQKLRVQVVNPGFVRTRLTDKNHFAMPSMLTPEQAAQAMVAGMQSGRFDVHFPRRFTGVLKAMRLLPAGLYATLMRRVAR